MSAAAQSTSNLPSGLAVMVSMPDVLFIPELVFGGLVWILVASSLVIEPNPQGWVMFVSVFCFVFTFLLMILFCAGVHKGSSTWAGIDAFYHGTAALFYLSASVLEAFTTIAISGNTDTDTLLKYYRENIAASVFAFVATLLYTIHTIFSALRWKSS
ncbi:myelin and lymphocyte protein-like isoform X2 [Protopterus annectens]|uniref:myelin and lymphocyte protein-like isoform X2 n=1 Tax=Protopterus annectens TaxID=7888 RepID=UPI001CFABD11|nr:myelin and lymphocyte protein-like isoform X2 [Protopterus annectens]